MKAIEAYSVLQRSQLRVFRESEVQALWRLERRTARRRLSELARAGLVKRLGAGWWASGETSLYQAVERLSEPHAAYVSLLSALFLHGMIEQIPTSTYAVTTGPARRMRTTIGTISFHHIPGEYFGGYLRTETGFPLATPEKALVDTLYLSGTKSRRFVYLPELELPARFDLGLCRAWTERIPSSRLRAMVERRLEGLIPSGSGSRPR